MKRWQTEVLSGWSDEQLRSYVSKFTVDDMKNWFMEDGKTWKLIGLASTRKGKKVQAVFEIMDKKGIATLKTLVDEIMQQRVVGMGIIRRKSRAKGKAKSKINRTALTHISQPMQQPMPSQGVQPQRYRTPLPATTIAPQLTQQVAQQVTEQLKQQQATVPTVATGSGRVHKSRAKAKSKLKTIKEDDEELTVIKPPNMTLGYYDALNDGFLMRRIH